MGRSGYHEYDGDEDNISMINWRGAVTSAIRGKRGQTLLRDMLAAFDAMPVKRLIAGDLVNPEGECCALGAVARARGIDVSEVEPTDRDQVADTFCIAPAMAAEIAYVNDDDLSRRSSETPEERFVRVRAWVASQIKPKT